jgi:hypothetical protein
MWQPYSGASGGDETRRRAAAGWVPPSPGSRAVARDAPPPCSRRSAPLPHSCVRPGSLCTWLHGGVSRTRTRLPVCPLRRAGALPRRRRARTPRRRCPCSELLCSSHCGAAPDQPPVRVAPTAQAKRDARRRATRDGGPHTPLAAHRPTSGRHQPGYRRPPTCAGTAPSNGGRRGCRPRLGARAPPAHASGAERRYPAGRGVRPKKRYPPGELPAPTGLRRDRHLEWRSAGVPSTPGRTGSSCARVGAERRYPAGRGVRPKKRYPPGESLSSSPKAPPASAAPTATAAGESDDGGLKAPPSLALGEPLSEQLPRLRAVPYLVRPAALVARDGTGRRVLGRGYLPRR